MMAPMPVRLLSFLALLASAIAATALAQEPELKTCSRLSGKEKAQCEWENHKAYKELLKQQAVQSVAEEPSGAIEAPAPAVQLPSCSRKQGQEKAKCLWEQQKLWKAMLLGGDSGSSAGESASNASARPARGRALGVPTACRPLKGKQRAQCIVKERQKARKG